MLRRAYCPFCFLGTVVLLYSTTRVVARAVRASPMRQLGATSGTERSPKLTHGAPPCNQCPGLHRRAGPGKERLYAVKELIEFSPRFAVFDVQRD
jgi:hypothetical protein